MVKKYLSIIVFLVFSFVFFNNSSVKNVRAEDDMVDEMFGDVNNEPKEGLTEEKMEKALEEPAGDIMEKSEEKPADEVIEKVKEEPMEEIIEIDHSEHMEE